MDLFHKLQDALKDNQFSKNELKDAVKEISGLLKGATPGFQPMANRLRMLARSLSDEV